MRNRTRKNKRSWKQVFLPILAMFSTVMPIHAYAQYVEFQYIATHGEVVAAKKFCFQTKDSQANKNTCYKLTDFPTVDLTNAKSLAPQVAQQIRPALKGFAWIEASDLALSSKDIENKAQEIHFIIRLRWRPQEISLTGIAPNIKPRGEIYALGLIHFDDLNAPDIQVGSYNTQGDLPNILQGLNEQWGASRFHEYNLIWLQKLLSPILSDYFKSDVIQIRP